MNERSVSMKALWNQHKKALLCGLAGLLAVWCLWYSRPVDVRFLLNRQTPDCVSGMVMAGIGSPWRTPKTRTFTVEGQDMEDLMEQLEDLRFRRSPLEPLLKVLPPLGGRSARTEAGETCYKIGFAFYSTENEEQWDTLLNLEFWIDRWTHGTYTSLPLSVPDGKEQGQALGAWLWDWAEEFDSVS